LLGRCPHQPFSVMGFFEIKSHKLLVWGWLRTVTWGRMDKGLPQLPSFHPKSQVLEIHKHWKEFQGVSQGVSQVKVLGRIYFSVTGWSINKGRGRGKEKHFLFPMKEIGARIQNGGPHLLVV
jgi:hypothetical protein